MSEAEPLYTIVGNTTPPAIKGTPGHHQDLVLIGTVTVILKYPAGGIRGVVLKIDVSEPALEIAVLAPAWPAGVCQGCRLWVRGRLANEAVERLKKATHYVEARHLALVRGPRPVAS